MNRATCTGALDFAAAALSDKPDKLKNIDLMPVREGCKGIIEALNWAVRRVSDFRFGVVHAAPELAGQYPGNTTIIAIVPSHIEGKLGIAEGMSILPQIRLVQITPTEYDPAACRFTKLGCEAVPTA